jgi:chorismate mutase
MSPSSRESNLAQLRERLAQLNSELFLTLAERRGLCQKIQGTKEVSGKYSHYDPEREIQLFKQLEKEIKELSLKELLAFSLIMEDHAMAMAPGSYPSWSNCTHIVNPKKELAEMVNPLLLKITHPNIYQRLILASEFSFLKDL